MDMLAYHGHIKEPKKMMILAWFCRFNLNSVLHNKSLSEIVVSLRIESHNVSY